MTKKEMKEKRSKLKDFKIDEEELDRVSGGEVTEVAEVRGLKKGVTDAKKYAGGLGKKKNNVKR